MTAKEYTSDRVFDGTRPLSPNRVEKLIANYAKSRLPDGVHFLSQESQDIMQRIAERSAALDARHTSKRVSL